MTDEEKRIEQQKMDFVIMEADLHPASFHICSRWSIFPTILDVGVTGVDQDLVRGCCDAAAALVMLLLLLQSFDL
ncbi:hypothetical protein NC651_032284 [Populus alba x Populus x berolinensis]|nr:hypothetical protein NC651_032284 [Populus alba x Populus x berolinensis]